MANCYDMREGDLTTSPSFLNRSTQGNQAHTKRIRYSQLFSFVNRFVSLIHFFRVSTIQRTSDCFGQVLQSDWFHQYMADTFLGKIFGNQFFTKSGTQNNRNIRTNSSSTNSMVSYPVSSGVEGSAMVVENPTMKAKRYTHP